MNIFGFPYWQIDEDGDLSPIVPSSVPETGEEYVIDLETPPVLLPGRAPGIEGTPFMEIVVQNNPAGGSLITWGLKRDFADPLPYRFDVYHSETPTGEYNRISSPVLINTYWAVDSRSRMKAVNIESYYAVRMTTPTGEYWSYASNANAFWSKKDWLIGRDICRKEFMLFRKFTGWYGFLLKRKVWGVDCPRCHDFDTAEPSDGHCTVCYGTGKEGGYWAPYPTFAYNMQGGMKEFKQVDDNIGLTENLVFPSMRMLGYPQLSTNDVFVQAGTWRRFFIRPVTVAAEIKGIPIVYVCELRLAPYTDVVYEYPKTTTPAAPVEPEPEPDYGMDPATSQEFFIQWVDGEWVLGVSDTDYLYTTSAGYPMASGLGSYTWLRSDGEPATLEFEAFADGWIVTGDDLVAGSYAETSTKAGLPVYSKVAEE